MPNQGEYAAGNAWTSVQKRRSDGGSSTRNTCVNTITPIPDNGADGQAGKSCKAVPEGKKRINPLFASLTARAVERAAGKALFRLAAGARHTKKRWRNADV